MSVATDPVELVLAMVGAMSADEKKRVMSALSADAPLLVAEAPATKATFVKPKGMAGARRVWMRTVTRIDDTKRGIEALEGEWCSDPHKVSAGSLVLMGERWPAKRWHLLKRVWGSDTVEVGGQAVAGVEIVAQSATDFNEIVKAARAALEPTW
jgi:hypothetical protein